MGDHGDVSRRTFLRRVGVLGAAAAVVPTLRLTAYGDSPGEAVATAVLDAVRPAFDRLAEDTVAGLVAFVVPGPDAWSKQQGVTSVRPGGVAAAGPGFLLHALDDFLPIPAELTRQLAAAFASGVSDVPLPAEVVAVPADVTRTFDEALRGQLSSGQAVPLSLVIALMLNWLATGVDPGSVAGPFTSPFANLSWDDKAEAFRRLEEEDAALVAMVDSGSSEPGTQSLSGLFSFVAGALLEFAAFGSYSEFGVLDPRTRRLRRRPVGWALSGYLGGRTAPVDGWDEFKGYYQGRRAARGTRRR